MNSKSPCFIIGISGPTRAGKTTLSGYLSEVLHCPIVHQDDYYIPLPIIHQKLDSNYELPECIDGELFYQDIVKQAELNDVLIVEGFQLYSFPKVTELLEKRVFMLLEEDSIKERRMLTNPCTEEYFKDKIMTEFEKYKEKCKSVEGLHYIDASMKPKEVLRECLNFCTNKEDNGKLKQKKSGILV